jgi:hypothetical protein
MSGLMKLALIRDTETPIGEPGHMHLNCRCGTEVPIPDDQAFDDRATVTCPNCRKQYNGAGWVL